jgi:flagellar protein FlaG
MKISNVDSLNAVNLSVKSASSPEVTESASNVQVREKTVAEIANEEVQHEVIDDDMLEKAVEQANKSLEGYNRYIERSVHEKTKAIMYVMKDSSTDEVIREFPPKKIQDMIAKMWELAGLFVDERA